MALVRLFGDQPSLRQVSPHDFHLAPKEKLEDQEERKLSIECRIDFSKHKDTGEVDTNGVPESWNQMIVEAPERTPFCRLRLDATWKSDGTPDGEVEQTLSWILTDSDDPAVIDDGKRRKLQPADRGRIRVIYIPAARDPERQIKVTTTTAFGRLLKGLSWGESEESVQKQLQALQAELGSVKGIETLNANVQDSWSKLYRGKVPGSVSFRTLDEEPADLLSLLAAHFQPESDGRVLRCDDLSDGQRTLFSLSLSVGIFQVEEAIKAAPNKSGYTEELAEELPILTIFAVEEPENHLSPHYLGAVVHQLTTVSGCANAQVLLSSHSPAILGRVKPDNVRYFIGNENVGGTQVKPIPLPSDTTDEAFKYVREAVRGNPELYFARLVIFGEGPSEEIILKRLFEASGTPLDINFISVVPLGGRHVNHFWRLVHGLGIPHLTLLDLDREKEGAGWARIQYVRDQLVRRLGPDSPNLKFKIEGDKEISLADDVYSKFATYDVKDADLMEGWLTFFAENFGVIFSSPLDIDFSMLEAFPNVYKAQAVRGPNLPKNDSPDYEAAVRDRVKQVLAANPKTAPDTTGDTFSADQRELFPWYKYLFLDDSKPVSHMRAMVALDDQTLLKKVPSHLKAIVDKAKALTEEK